MRKFIASWNANVEFFVVMGLAFGLFTLLSLEEFFRFFVPGQEYGVITDTNGGLIELIIVELILFSIIVYILYCRNWQNKKIDLRFSWEQVAAGALLFLVTYLVSVLVYALGMALFSLNSPGVEFDNRHLGLFPVLLLSIINPIYEELLVVVYIMVALEERKGTLFAINASIFIRLIYHLYQGAQAVLFILPVGIVFILVYVKWRRIWPLIIAHGLMDFFALYS